MASCTHGWMVDNPDIDIVYRAAVVAAGAIDAAELGAHRVQFAAVAKV